MKTTVAAKKGKKAKKKTKTNYESYKPTPYLIRILEETDKELREGRYKTAHSVEELIRDLER